MPEMDMDSASIIAQRALADNAAGVSPREFLVAGIIMLSFTTLFVAMRIAANLRRGQTLGSDIIASLSVILLGAFVGLSYYMNEYIFVDPTTPVERLLLFSQFSFWVAAAVMWCSKAPVLLLLITLFGVHRWLRIVSYTTLAVLGIATITSTAVSSGACDPRTQAPSVSFILACSNTSSTVGVGLGVVSVIVDVIIMVIPMPIIFKLKLPKHKKVGLVIIFTSGIFAVIASAISVYYKWQSKKGSTTSVTATMVCTMVESCIATIVGCVPATYTFWSQIVPESSFYTRLASFLSSQTRKQSQETTHAKVSEDLQQFGGHGGSSSTERINNYNPQLPPNAQYKPMQDGFYVTYIPLSGLQQHVQEHV